MAEFAYNNTNHCILGYTPFELNSGYHPHVSYEEDVDSHSKSKVVDELTKKLKYLIPAYKKNILLAQELQKRSHDIETKPRSLTPNKKIWLSSKYIKNKCNGKLKTKLFRPFRV